LIIRARAAKVGRAMTVGLRFLGSGDALGSGGRFQTCIELSGAEPARVLLDFGASSLVALRRAGVETIDVEWVLLTHLHGDHFGGLPFLVLDGQFRRRTRPLRIVGPAGVGERVRAAMEVFFPGLVGVAQRFAVEFVELSDRRPTPLGPARVTPFAVAHASGAPAYALRVEYGGKIVVYSGDTEWTEALVEAVDGADVFVCEAYFFDKRVRHHLDYRTLMEHRARLRCGRLILTHMSQDMLERVDLDAEVADDLKVVTL
jgi:ribonuclease BN (tRNA processing enzyme)